MKSTLTFCLFVNFRSDVSYCSSALEELLANELMREGVLPINGHMDKIEKFAHVRLFTCSIVLRGHRFRVLVATSAANTGIDQPRTTLVTRYGLPRDATTLLQEKGRLVRKPGMIGRFDIYTDWVSWIILVISTLTPLANQSEDNEDCAYVNSSIESRSLDKGSKAVDKNATVSEEQEPQRPLSKKE